MTATRLAELLGQYALAHPHQRLADVTALAFAVWCASSGLTMGERPVPYRLTLVEDDPPSASLRAVRPQGSGVNK